MTGDDIVIDCHHWNSGAVENALPTSCKLLGALQQECSTFLVCGLGEDSFVMFTGYWTLPGLLELWHTRTGDSCAICGVWFECLAYAVQGLPALCIVPFRYSLFCSLCIWCYVVFFLLAWKILCIQLAVFVCLFSMFVSCHDKICPGTFRRHG